MKYLLPFLSGQACRAHRLLLVLPFVLLGLQTDLYGTHYRYGSIFWEPVPGQQNTVRFTIKQAWRKSFFSGVAIGAQVSTGFMEFGDFTTENILLNVTSVDDSEDWFFGETTIIHTYPSAGAYTATYEGCCRISTLENNPDGAYRQETTVNVGSGNSSPTTSLPPIVNFRTGLNPATIQIPGFDPDGDALSYRMADVTETDAFNPSDISISPDGLLSFPTDDKAPGELWTTAVVIEDGDTKVIVDFIIRIVGQSTPPGFDFTVTPPSGTVLQVAPSQTVNFEVEASDSDDNSQVTLNATGVPPGSTFSPQLPTQGNPVRSTFNWTPALSDFGSYLINITATDEVGVQTSTDVTVVVSLDPVFSPGSPGDGSFFCLQPGDPFNQLYEVTDPDPSDVVSLDAGINPNPPTNLTPPPFTPGGGFPLQNALPSSLNFAPPLPTAAANPSSSTLSGTVDQADWGIYPVLLTATDAFGDQTQIANYFVLNTFPRFTTPEPGPITITANEPFSITISGTDDDLPLGDRVAFADPGQDYVDVPDWLSFDDDGNGNLTLSGTPTAADVGTHALQIELHDRTTHYLHQHCSWQFQNFTIEVLPDDDAPEASVFVLWDAQNNQPIGPLNDGAELDQADFPLKVTIQAQLEGPEVGSVAMSLDGPLSHSMVENNPPYTLFGNQGLQLKGKFLPAGTYTLSATPYGQRRGRGTPGATESISFSVVGPDPAVSSFTLVDAVTDTDLRTLADGDQIDAAAVPGPLNIRVDMASPGVRSVHFMLTGPTTHERIENVTPYALFGDRRGDYFEGTLSPGAYTLTATPYTRRNAFGAAGDPISIQFTYGIVPQVQVRDEDPAGLMQPVEAPRLRVFPNPVRDMLRVELPRLSGGERLQLSLISLSGRQIDLSTYLGEGADQLNLSRGQLQLPAGLYILQARTDLRQFDPVRVVLE